MPSEGHYDDSAFIYFVLSVLLIAIIPSSWYYLKIWKKAFSKKYFGLCNCEYCHMKATKIQIDSRKPSKMGLIKFTLFILLLALFFYLLQSATQSIPSEATLFDPYNFGN